MGMRFQNGLKNGVVEVVNKVDVHQEKGRIIGLDILRILFALLIFLFHSRSRLHCDYGVFNDFLYPPDLAMTGFFILSGYALFVAYGEQPLCDKQSIMMFYKKRFVAIYPLYFFVGFIAVIMFIVAGTQTVKDNLLLVPIEILGIQSFFQGAFFSYSHNSGTWFVSCIIFCYLLFPLVKQFASSFTRVRGFLLVLFFILLLSYCHSLPKFFDCGGLYTNPFVRLFEFILGMILAVIIRDYDKSVRGDMGGDNSLIFRFLYVEFVIAIILFIISWKTPFRYVTMYILFPIVFLLSGKKTRLGIGRKYNLLVYVSKLTYAFFLGQFFVWNPLKYLQLKVGEFSNCFKIVVSFILCWIVAIVLHEIVEKKIGGLIYKRVIGLTA